MKSSILIVLALSTARSAAFSPAPTTAFARAVIAPVSTTTLFAQVELEPEPTGGEELTLISTMLDVRMKKMEAAKDVTSENGEVFNFWLSAVADGSLIKEYRISTLNQAKKNANFPGFRKGQVPPYAQPQITMFAVQEGLLKTIESAVKAFGLQSLEGSDGEVTVLEDVEAMCKGYNVGDSVPFTASFKATFDPEVAQPSTSSSPSDAIDVEVE